MLPASTWLGVIVILEITGVEVSTVKFRVIVVVLPAASFATITTLLTAVTED